MRNFVRLPAPGGAEVIIQSERPLPSEAWLVVGQIAELLNEVHQRPAARITDPHPPTAQDQRGRLEAVTWP